MTSSGTVLSAMVGQLSSLSWPPPDLALGGPGPPLPARRFRAPLLPTRVTWPPRVTWGVPTSLVPKFNCLKKMDESEDKKKLVAAKETNAFKLRI